MDNNEVAMSWTPEGVPFYSVPRYCFAARLVVETAQGQAWDNEHDFRAVVSTAPGEYGPVSDVNFHCARCLLQLTGAQANLFHRAVIGKPYAPAVEAVEA